MDASTPDTSRSFTKAPAAGVLSTDSDEVEVVTISDDDDDDRIERPPVRRQRLSFNIKASIEECQQLFGATCHVKLTKCQLPANAAAASPTTVKENDSSVDDADSSCSERNEPSRTVPSKPDEAPASNNVRKLVDESSTGSRSDIEETLPTEKPRRKKKRGRKPTVKTANCTVCRKTLSTKQSLKIHMRTHASNKERLHKCEHCGRSYGVLGSLTWHKKENPNGSCKLKDRVKRIRQEKIAKRARELLEQEWRPRESWKCKICEKKMKGPGNYLGHMRSHAGVRPFKCDECGKSFAHLTTLSYHRKIHGGVREFSCAFCGKGFYQEQNLFSHLRVHTEEKPFFCVVIGCGKSFRHARSIKMHQRLIHLKKC